MHDSTPLLLDEPFFMRVDRIASYDIYFLCRYCCAGSLALRFVFLLRLSWSSGQCCLATFSSPSPAFAFQAMPFFYSLPYIDRRAHGFFYRFYSCAQVVLAVLATRGRTPVRRKTNALGAIEHKPSYLPRHRRFFYFFFVARWVQ